MIKRNTDPAEEGGLPITTNDDNINSVAPTKNFPKTSNQNRRRSTGKTLLRIIVVSLFFFVICLYVLGTRYVLLISPSIPSTSGRRSINDIVNNGGDHRPVLFQSIIVDNVSEYRNNERRTVDAKSRQRHPLSVSQKPRVLGHYYARTDSTSLVGTERLDPNLKRLYDNTKSRINREVFMTRTEQRRQKDLLDSHDYDDGKADTMQDQGKNCVAQYDWQETSIRTCNLLMEVDMTNLNYLPMFHENHYNNKHDLPVASSSLHSYSQIISNGYWRDVWKIENLLRYKGNEEETFILKTQRYEHDFEERNLDRHRRDAVSMEQLSPSKFIMDIYSFCGSSGLFQFADGGDLSDAIEYNNNLKEDGIEKPWTPEEKMIIAYQIISGLTDLHNFAKEGVPAISHTDIDTGQFVYVEEDGLYKLNDFNRARFIGKNKKTGELCKYHIGSNPGTVSLQPPSTLNLIAMSTRFRY